MFFADKFYDTEKGEGGLMNFLRMEDKLKRALKFMRKRERKWRVLFFMRETPQGKNWSAIESNK